MKLKELYNKISTFLVQKLNVNEKNVMLVLALFIVILVNIAGATLKFRIDLTRNKSYSLSDKSKEVVSNLKEKLKIRVLFSKDLPAIHVSVYRYLRDILEEYDFYGNRYFSYEIVSEKELDKQARDFGIRSVTSREFRSDQTMTRRVYMALVIQHADLVEKIEAVTDTVGLEYKMTSLINKMTGKIDGLLSLKKPIKVSLYLDKSMLKLPINGIDKVEKIVSDAVSGSNQRNYDKIRFKLVDSTIGPEGQTFSELYGIRKLRWKSDGSSSNKKGKEVEGVFGLVVQAGKRFGRIEINIAPSLFGGYVVAGVDNLENKINNAVSRLLSSNQKVGYITGHREIDINNKRAREPGAGLLKEVLSDLYEIKIINLKKESIPDDIGAIIINGPAEKFSDYELFKIDQYLMNGKAALFLVNSFKEMRMPVQFRQRQPMVLPVNTGLEKLLKHYGITVNKDIVLDKNCAKIPFANMIKDYPLVPIIRKSGLNHDNLITKYLNSVLFIKSSSISVDEKRIKELGVTKVDLISTSSESWLMKGRINFHPLMMSSGSGKMKMKSYNIASLLSGKFESYFKGKEVPEPEKVKEKGKGKKKTIKRKTGKKLIETIKKIDSTIKTGRTDLIVIGSSEITNNNFMLFSRNVLSKGARRGGGANEHLLHNIVDYLTGNYYVPEMKVKSLDVNPLEKTTDNARFILKIINMGGVPLIVIIIGLLILRRRVVRRRKLLSMFSAEGQNE